jgi:hypothetical protein
VESPFVVLVLENPIQPIADSTLAAVVLSHSR